MIITNATELTTEMLPPSQRNEQVCNMCGETRSVKYRLTNPTTKETRHFCNLCYLKLMVKLENAHEVINDSFFRNGEPYEEPL